MSFNLTPVESGRTHWPLTPELSRVNTRSESENIAFHQAAREWLDLFAYLMGWRPRSQKCPFFVSFLHRCLTLQLIFPSIILLFVSSSSSFLFFFFFFIYFNREQQQEQQWSGLVRLFFFLIIKTSLAFWIFWRVYKSNFNI